MKKLIPLLLLLPSLLFAEEPYRIAIAPAILGGAGGAAAAACDDCSGSLIFSSHFEGTSYPFDVTTGIPCGCSDHATKTLAYTGASNSDTWASDGVYSFRQATDIEYAVASLANGTTSSVSIQFDFYFTTWDDATKLIKVYQGAGEAVNNLEIWMGTTDEIACGWYGNSTYRAGPVSAAWDLQASTKYTIRVQARSGTSPYFRMTLDGGELASGTSATTEMTAAYDTIRIGDTLTDAPVFYVDNLYVWNDWQTGAVWGD